MNIYDQWAASPEGKAAIEREIANAELRAKAYRARLKYDAERAQTAWHIKSQHRAVEGKINDRLGKYSGRIDDTYTAEVPLTLAWNSYKDGTALVYVSLGGVDVSEYLPPDVLADIRSHIELCDEPENAA